jgi:hypothetical protein
VAGLDGLGHDAHALDSVAHLGHAPLGLASLRLLPLPLLVVPLGRLVAQQQPRHLQRHPRPALRLAPPPGPLLLLHSLQLPLQLPQLSTTVAVVDLGLGLGLVAALLADHCGGVALAPHAGAVDAEATTSAAAADLGALLRSNAAAHLLGPSPQHRHLALGLLQRLVRLVRRLLATTRRWWRG